MDSSSGNTSGNLLTSPISDSSMSFGDRNTETPNSTHNDVTMVVVGGAGPATTVGYHPHMAYQYAPPPQYQMHMHQQHQQHHQTPTHLVIDSASSAYSSKPTSVDHSTTSTPTSFSSQSNQQFSIINYNGNSSSNSGVVKLGTPNTSTTSTSSSSAAALTVDQLRTELLKQFEYYFSKKNLATDTYLLSQMDQEDYVPISVIAEFRKVKSLTSDLSLIIDIIRQSTQLVPDPTLTKVRSINGRLGGEQYQQQSLAKRCILMLREVAAEATLEQVRELFTDKEPNCPPCIQCESAGNNSWYVSFSNEEEAQQALQYLKGDVQLFLNKPIRARIKAHTMPRSSSNFTPSSLPQQFNSSNTPPLSTTPSASQQQLQSSSSSLHSTPSIQQQQQQQQQMNFTPSATSSSTQSPIQVQQTAGTPIQLQYNPNYLPANANQGAYQFIMPLSQQLNQPAQGQQYGQGGYLSRIQQPQGQYIVQQGNSTQVFAFSATTGQPLTAQPAWNPNQSWSQPPLAGTPNSQQMARTIDNKNIVYSPNSNPINLNQSSQYPTQIAYVNSPALNIQPAINYMTTQITSPRSGGNANTTTTTTSTATATNPTSPIANSPSLPKNSSSNSISSSKNNSNDNNKASKASNNNNNTNASQDGASSPSKATTPTEASAELQQQTNPVPIDYQGNPAYVAPQLIPQPHPQVILVNQSQYPAYYPGSQAGQGANGQPQAIQFNLGPNQYGQQFAQVAGGPYYIQASYSQTPGLAGQQPLHGVYNSSPIQISGAPSNGQSSLPIFNPYFIQQPGPGATNQNQNNVGNTYNSGTNNNNNSGNTNNNSSNNSSANGNNGNGANGNPGANQYYNYPYIYSNYKPGSGAFEQPVQQPSDGTYQIATVAPNNYHQTVNNGVEQQLGNPNQPVQTTQGPIAILSGAPMQSQTTILPPGQPQHLIINPIGIPTQASPLLASSNSLQSTSPLLITTSSSNIAQQQHQQQQQQQQSATNTPSNGASNNNNPYHQPTQQTHPGQQRRGANLNNASTNSASNFHSRNQNYSNSSTSTRTKFSNSSNTPSNNVSVSVNTPDQPQMILSPSNNYHNSHHPSHHHPSNYHPNYQHHPSPRQTHHHAQHNNNQSLNSNKSNHPQSHHHHNSQYHHYNHQQHMSNQYHGSDAESIENQYNNTNHNHQESSNNNNGNGANEKKSSSSSINSTDFASFPPLTSTSNPVNSTAPAPPPPTNSNSNSNSTDSPPIDPAIISISKDVNSIPTTPTLINTVNTSSSSNSDNFTVKEPTVVSASAAVAKQTVSSLLTSLQHNQKQSQYQENNQQTQQSNTSKPNKKGNNPVNNNSNYHSASPGANYVSGQHHGINSQSSSNFYNQTNSPKSFSSRKQHQQHNENAYINSNSPNQPASNLSFTRYGGRHNNMNAPKNNPRYQQQNHMGEQPMGKGHKSSRSSGKHHALNNNNSNNMNNNGNVSKSSAASSTTSPMLSPAPTPSITTSTSNLNNSNDNLIGSLGNDNSISPSSTYDEEMSMLGNNWNKRLTFAEIVQKQNQSPSSSSSTTPSSSSNQSSSKPNNLSINNGSDAPLATSASSSLVTTPTSSTTLAMPSASSISSSSTNTTTTIIANNSSNNNASAVNTIESSDDAKGYRHQKSSDECDDSADYLLDDANEAAEKSAHFHSSLSQPSPVLTGTN